MGRYLTAKYGITAAFPLVNLPDTAADPVLWYDVPSQLGLANGQTISRLQDFSASANDGVSQATANFPAYVTNAPSAFGGRPVVRFNGADDNWFAFTERADIRTVFWVIKEDADATAGPRFLLGDDNSYAFHRGDGKLLWQSTYASAAIQGGQTYLNGQRIEGHGMATSRSCWSTTARCPMRSWRASGPIWKPSTRWRPPTASWTMRAGPRTSR